MLYSPPAGVCKSCPRAPARVLTALRIPWLAAVSAAARQRAPQKSAGCGDPRVNLSEHRSAAAALACFVGVKRLHRRTGFSTEVTVMRRVLWDASVLLHVQKPDTITFEWTESSLLEENSQRRFRSPGGAFTWQTRFHPTPSVPRKKSGPTFKTTRPRLSMPPTPVSTSFCDKSENVFGMGTP